MGAGSGSGSISSACAEIAKSKRASSAAKQAVARRPIASLPRPAQRSARPSAGDCMVTPRPDRVQSVENTVTRDMTILLRGAVCSNRSGCDLSIRSNHSGTDAVEIAWPSLNRPWSSILYKQAYSTHAALYPPALFWANFRSRWNARFARIEAADARCGRSRPNGPPGSQAPGGGFEDNSGTEGSKYLIGARTPVTARRCPTRPIAMIRGHGVLAVECIGPQPFLELMTQHEMPKHVIDLPPAD